MYSIFKLLNLLQLKRLVRQKDSSCLPPPCDSAAPASEASSTRASSHILQSRSRDHLHQSRSTFPSPVDAPRAAASPTARTPVEAPRAGARSRGPRWTRPAPPAHSEPAVRARPARTPVNARPRGPRWTPPAASPLPERQRRCPLARAHQRPDAPISGGQAPAPISGGRVREAGRGGDPTRGRAGLPRVAPPRGLRPHAVAPRRHDLPGDQLQTEEVEAMARAAVDRSAGTMEASGPRPSSMTSSYATSLRGRGSFTHSVCISFLLND